jgi:hypothetical protein
MLTITQAFYQQGLQNFSSSLDGASELHALANNVAQIGADESNHVVRSYGSQGLD